MAQILFFASFIYSFGVSFDFYTESFYAKLNRIYFYYWHIRMLWNMLKNTQRPFHA